MKPTTSSPPSQARTPLGAYPNLQNDPRIAEISQSADHLLSKLVRHCEKRTASIYMTHARLVRLYRISVRTLRRRLAELHSVQLIRYEPGNGRGNASRIVLRFDTWGPNGEKAARSPDGHLSKEQRGRLAADVRTRIPAWSAPPLFCRQGKEKVATAAAGPSEERTREPVPENHVVCTPTPDNDVPPLSRGDHDRRLKRVLKFHKWGKTPEYKLTPFFLDREIDRVGRIEERYSIQEQRDAGGLLKYCYGRFQARRHSPIHSIGLLGYYCRHLPDLARDILDNQRRGAYRVTKRAKVARGDFKAAFRRCFNTATGHFEEQTGVNLRKVTKKERPETRGRANQADPDRVEISPTARAHSANNEFSENLSRHSKRQHGPPVPVGSLFSLPGK